MTVTFEDGTQETGNLLVGSEGAHSPTRDFLLGPKEAELLPSPAVASVTITTLSREASIALRKLHPRYTISFHPNGTFTWMSSEFSLPFTYPCRLIIPSPRLLRRRPRKMDLDANADMAIRRTDWPDW